MANLKSRVEKLEQAAGSGDAPRFLAVLIEPGETRKQALERTLEEDGLTRDQVGRVLFVGPGIDGLSEQMDLLTGLGSTMPGQVEFWNELYRSIKERGEQRLSNIIKAKIEAEAQA